MTPKERVRIGVYKTLLEEEKNKNKRKSHLTISVFVIGIFAGSLYNFIPQEKEMLTSSRVISSESVVQKATPIDNYFSIGVESTKKEIQADEYFVLNIQS